jgi:Zn-dependent peptidase ImmA (M78 family)
MSDRHAESLVKDLGITDPKDIDLDAIAHLLGVTVQYQPLRGCEALIVGSGQRAIVKINSDSLPERQRFSLGHELGHWHYHRGKMLYCAQDDIESDASRARETELTADNYSASLLMPGFLFSPSLASKKRITWKTVREISKEFNCSLLATALRVIDLNVAPMMFVMLREGRRIWFRSARDVDSRWFPQKSPDTDSFAFDLSFDSSKQATGPRKVQASSWFDRRSADRLDLIEDSIRMGDCVYSLLTLEGDEFQA